jgi:hypothetical protein
MIALITPTGARPNQAYLFKFFMQRQTYDGAVVWIISDDCEPRTTDHITPDFRLNWTVIKLYPHPPWRQGMNTQARNIEECINCLMINYDEKDIEAIFIIEDDDYYRPTYLERMMARFNDFKVLGEMNTVYYNVMFRTYFINRNTSHSSLFQVALRPVMLPLFKSCYHERFIDFKFYEKLHAQEFVRRGEVGFFNENNLAIGMKGITGRGGIGAGHGRLLNMYPDPQMTWLYSQIPHEDAKLYEGYYGNYRQSQHLLFTKKSD